MRKNGINGQNTTKIAFWKDYDVIGIYGLRRNKLLIEKILMLTKGYGVTCQTDYAVAYFLLNIGKPRQEDYSVTRIMIKNVPSVYQNHGTLQSLFSVKDEAHAAIVTYGGLCSGLNTSPDEERTSKDAVESPYMGTIQSKGITQLLLLGALDIIMTALLALGTTLNLPNLHYSQSGSLAISALLTIGTNMGAIDINTLTIEKYLALTRMDIPGVVIPELRNDVNFEIKSQFMSELRCYFFADAAIINMEERAERLTQEILTNNMVDNAKTKMRKDIEVREEPVPFVLPNVNPYVEPTIPHVPGNLKEQEDEAHAFRMLEGLKS
nr:sec7 domain-containing protein [Tanacetum cinerariifolium]